MSIVIGIDVGGSTTKIVGFEEKNLLNPMFVKANDPIASIYGAFGKFTAVNKIPLDKISRVMITGVGSSFITDSIFGISTTHVTEFEATGRGGLYLTGLDEAIIVSMGTGTAIVHAKKDDINYLGGTGVGGGTIVGLSKKMLGILTVEHIIDLAKNGDLSNIDLKIHDITSKKIIPSLPSDITAANFGKLSDMATDADIALGIINLVCETIAMMTIFAARQKDLLDVVLTGNLTTIPQAKEIFAKLSAMFGYRFHMSENAQFGTVIGAALTYFI
ncbi:MAG: pantothenate kinase [Clostridiales bacterium GWF2_38_85]|nr:MAG: pantothenate kinase [Clostridiales bacterium GWF2_38_85]HBL84464.1 type II pantothenate kinase [Clostridiales bacterium]